MSDTNGVTWNIRLRSSARLRSRFASSRQLLAPVLSGDGLDERTVHVLLGEAVEYDMGNMFDPAYTMVCKIPKNILEQIGTSREG